MARLTPKFHIMRALFYLIVSKLDSANFQFYIRLSSLSILNQTLCFVLLSGLSLDALASSQQECSTSFKIASTADDLSPDDRERLSRLIRSDPTFFFKSKIVQNWLDDSDWSQYKSMIYGDGHIGNMGPLFINKKARWGSIDWDDMGVGPLVLGLAKSIIIAKLEAPDIKTKRAVTSFVDGLKGISDSPPRLVEQSLEMNRSKYLEYIDLYVKKHTETSGDQKITIRKDEGMSNASESETSLVTAGLQGLGTNLEILDIVKYKKPYGGSKDAVRYRVLIYLDKRLTILDVKQVLPSAILAVNKDENSVSNANTVFDHVFQGDVELKSLIKLKNLWFFVTPRYSMPYLFDLAVTDSEFEELFIELSLFNINQQGLEAKRFCDKHEAHDCKELAEKVLKDFDSFVTYLKEVLIHPSIDDFVRSMNQVKK